MITNICLCTKAQRQSKNKNYLNRAKTKLYERHSPPPFLKKLKFTAP